MQVNGIITFTTDFGTSDPYAGIMKGVALGANPDARLVDITHEIPPHAIVDGAFTLARACHFFPEGTIHVAVVDPGVGGSRKNIVVKTGKYYFVGPDNGIFSLVLDREKPVEIRHIKNEPYIRETVSNTFHGRDVFAPCAGLLSTGGDFSHVGPVIKRYHKLKYPRVVREGNTLKGEVVSIDSFGNMITNITEHRYKSFAGKKQTKILFGSEHFDGVSRQYSDVPKGSPLALFGSSGFLEISMNEGNAASYFMASIQFPVTVRK